MKFALRIVLFISLAPFAFGLVSCSDTPTGPPSERSPNEVFFRVDGELLRGSVWLFNEKGFAAVRFNVHNESNEPVPQSLHVESIDFTVDGKRQKLSATLEKMEDESVKLASAESPGPEWGFDVQSLTPEVAEQLGLSSSSGGVVVTEVDPASGAGRAGLRRGDVILEANRAQIKKPKDLETALAGSGEHAVLLVQRGESTLYVAVERDE